MHEFWYDYVKPKYGEDQNCVTWVYMQLCNMIYCQCKKRRYLQKYCKIF